MQQRMRLVDRVHPSHTAISLPKVAITLNSDQTQPLVVRVFSWWQEWSANTNPIENSVLFARPPSICSTFDTLWQQRITAAFGARLKYCCFGNPRSPERYEECRRFVEKEKSRVDGDRDEILRYFSLSFMLLGRDHVLGVPERVLDIALPGLVQLGHGWNQRLPGPWELVHDQSSNMVKQKWIWDAYSAATMPPATFDAPGVVAQFPMNVLQTRFADSVQQKQLQICDVLAGDLFGGPSLRQK
jgi:hypothetical protein